MSYQWTSASTPQGRERLNELMDKGIRVVGKREGKIDEFFYSNERMGGCYWIGKMTWKSLWNDVVLSNDFHGVEFLDPEPPKPQPDENGLLPCPFCGEAKFIECGNMYGNPLYKFIVTCKHCGATSCDSETKDDAIAAWNTRAGKEANP